MSVENTVADGGYDVCGVGGGVILRHRPDRYVNDYDENVFASSYQ